MTEQQTRTAAGDGTIPQPRSAGGATIGGDSAPDTGWVVFGGVLMAVIGGFGVIEGLAALFAPTYFIAFDGAVLTIDLTAWGWVHLILGALALITGLALLGNAPSWARGVGIGLIAVNMLVQLAWLPAYPVWSIVAIALDVIVIFALVATWPAKSARIR